MAGGGRGGKGVSGGSFLVKGLDMAADRRLWPKQTWAYPMPHDFQFGFELGMDDLDTLKQSTMIAYAFQDNAIVDYEEIKTNPENFDFAVKSNGNCAAGSYVPRCSVSWQAFCTATDVDILKFMYMPVHTAMLNRLEAFDKKTGNTIETILELTHETGDEQCFPLYNGTKLYEGHHVIDLPFPDHPGPTTNGQPEGIAFDIEQYFDALHYYTNKEMLRTITGRMQTFRINQDLAGNIPTKDKIASYFRRDMPSICKYQHPYTMYAGLYHLPLAGTHNQYQQSNSVTQEGHLIFVGRVRFNEYNPDFNFARA